MRNKTRDTALAGIKVTDAYWEEPQAHYGGPFGAGFSSIQ